MENILLIKRAIKGNKDAFSLLIENYKEELYKIAYLYTKNEDDALEAIGECIYKAYISITKLKHPEFFKTWLIRILINECVALLKKKNKIVLENDDVIFDVPCNDTCDQGFKYEDLYNALNLLNDKQRTAIILKYFDDLKISEIAAIMNVPDNTVKSHIKRGLTALKKSLGGNLSYE